MTNEMSYNAIMEDGLESLAHLGALAEYHPNGDPMIWIRTDEGGALEIWTTATLGGWQVRERKPDGQTRNFGVILGDHLIESVATILREGLKG
ncbi:MAG: hypothetical protein LC798_12875 [Chloroflexi bacterium]|nr:hypothetical protein [Chloroflexota bacterium]